MKKLISILSFVLALAVSAVPCFAQATALTQTTLAAAVSTTSTTSLRLTSATGVTATSTILWIDQEALFVNAVNGTTISVTRGYNGTQSGTHSSGATVWLGPASSPAFIQQAPNGSCSRNGITVPVIAFGITGMQPLMGDCVGNQWVFAPVVKPVNVPFKILSANSGGTAYTSLNTNGTTVVAGTLYCAELDVPVSKLATGLGILFGTTAGGSDKHLAVLLDSQGNVLANSALAGATNSSASVYVNFAFTTPYYVVGGAQYYACTQSNGTSDTIRMLVTGTQDTYLTTSKTGSFGTVPTITVPTGFTTAVGPYAYLY